MPPAAAASAAAGGAAVNALASPRPPGDPDGPPGGGGDNDPYDPLKHVVPDLTEAEDRYYSLSRNSGNIIFVIAYSWVMYQLSGEATFATTSGIKGDFLDEFVPPLDKETERVQTMEYGQNLDKNIQADDITKVLSLAQKFCIKDSGMNDHFPGNYVCRFSVQFQMAKGQEVHPNFSPQLDCSQEFLEKYVVEGDDPYDRLFGEFPLELETQRGGKPDDMYDEPYHLAFKKEVFEYLDDDEADRIVEDKAGDIQKTPKEDQEKYIADMFQRWKEEEEQQKQWLEQQEERERQRVFGDNPTTASALETTDGGPAALLQLVDTDGLDALDLGAAFGDQEPGPDTRVVVGPAGGLNAALGRGAPHETGVQREPPSELHVDARLVSEEPIRDFPPPVRSKAEALEAGAKSSVNAGAQKENAELVEVRSLISSLASRLDGRDKLLDAEQKRLAEREQALQAREAQDQQREKELDEREQALKREQAAAKARKTPSSLLEVRHGSSLVAHARRTSKKARKQRARRANRTAIRARGIDQTYDELDTDARREFLEFVKDEEERDVTLDRMDDNFPPQCFAVTREALNEAEQKGFTGGASTYNMTDDEFNAIFGQADDWYVRNTCRNHHWGLLAACQPAWIRVVFTVVHGSLGSPLQLAVNEIKHGPKEVQVLKQFDFIPHMFVNFKLLMETSGPPGSSEGEGEGYHRGVYDISLDSNQGEYPGHKGYEDIFAAILFYMCYLIFFYSETCAVFKFPFMLVQLLLKRKQVTRLDQATNLVLDLFDPFRKERKYVSVLQLAIGWLVAILILVAFVNCLIHFFSKIVIPPVETLLPSTTMCGRQGWTLYGYTMQCLDTNPHTGSESKAAEFIMSPLFNTGGLKWHERAIALLFFQSLSIFNNFSQTAWIGNTFGRAAYQLMNSLLVYFTLVVGFSFLVFISFGGDCKQFSTVGDTMWALLLFSFGIQDVSIARTDPRYFVPSTNLYNYLLAFQIMVVMVALNVFTTIIIDAYTASKFDTDWHSASLQNQVFVLGSFAWFFPNMDLDHPDDEDVREAQRDYNQARGSIFGALAGGQRGSKDEGAATPRG